MSTIEVKRFKTVRKVQAKAGQFKVVATPGMFLDANGGSVKLQTVDSARKSGWTTYTSVSTKPFVSDTTPDGEEFSVNVIPPDQELHSILEQAAVEYILGLIQ